MQWYDKCFSKSKIFPTPCICSCFTICTFAHSCRCISPQTLALLVAEKIRHILGVLQQLNDFRYCQGGSGNTKDHQLAHLLTSHAVLYTLPPKPEHLVHMRSSAVLHFRSVPFCILDLSSILFRSALFRKIPCSGKIWWGL